MTDRQSGLGMRNRDQLPFLKLAPAAQISIPELSGIGGDEFTGGVPTPVPELADLLVRAKFRKLAQQLKVWAIAKRSPWFHLLWEALGQFAPSALAGIPEHTRPTPWIEPRFIKRHEEALSGYPRRWRFLGPLPSFQENFLTLSGMRRQVSCAASTSGLLCERRYPYLDRDFLEFIFAIPREQLARPGERRSLMRRALSGIVPDALLRRERKAFVARSPRVTISNQWASLVAMSREMVSASLGLVDSRAFSQALEEARCGKRVAIIPLLRTFEMESCSGTFGLVGFSEMSQGTRLPDDRSSPRQRIPVRSHRSASISAEKKSLGKEDKTMTYTKPEVLVLGQAIDAV